MTDDKLSRRAFMAATAVAGATLILPESLSAAPSGKTTFTILHTNDLHSNLIGMAPALDYTPATLNDDATRGGFERLATKIAELKAARQAEGPVLVLDAGDYSMGTAFAGATRETGAELHLLSRMGCDATTFGNHDFDLGPDGTAQSIAAAAKAGRVPAVVASNTDFTANDATLAGLQRLANDGVVRRTLVIERGGIRFGILGVLGKEAQFYTGGAGAVKLPPGIRPALPLRPRATTPPSCCPRRARSTTPASTPRGRRARSRRSRNGRPSWIICAPCP
jgi:5'-nucleotidase